MVGLSKGYISQMVNNRSEIPAKVLIGLKKSYASVNIDWLLTGEGEMLLDEKPMAGEVKEAGGEYRISKKGDPLGALRTVLEDLDQRVRTLEAEMASLKKGKE